MLNHFKYKHYKGTIEFNKEDNCYYGKVINIRDLVSYEAKTPFELKKKFTEAVEDYLDICEEIGKKSTVFD